MVAVNGVDGMDERALIGAAQAGNEAAFAQLFDTYHGPITGYLYRMVGDRDVADDLAQDTFVKAYRALGRTDPGLNFRAWLYRIATNTALSYLRRQRLLRWLPFGPGVPEPSGEPHLAERLGERELIEAALQRINRGYASALLLRHHQGLSLAEVADTLGISVNGAKVRLFRARKAFVEAYETLSGESKEHPS